MSNNSHHVAVASQDSSRPSRRRIAGVSTKMYFSHQQTLQYLNSCLDLSKQAQALDVDIFIIPDFLSLSTSSSILKDETYIRLGAQDCHWEDSGAFTGEVSPKVLRELGVSIVELGHAERRKLFGETDELVVKKAVAAERNGIVPLVCIGEKSRGQVAEAVEECKPQFLPVLEATSGEVILAYEPVWAIGASEPASAEYVVAVTTEFRKLCGDRAVRILYGGSAGPGTFEKLMNADKEGLSVDGLFLGRFAHDIKNFERVISEVAGREAGL